MNATDTNTDTRVIATRCYSGSVAAPGHENPAAHGNVEYTVERADGARRKELCNGLHEEVGPWGPTRAERREVLDRAERSLRLALAARPAAHGVAIDEEGYLVVSDGDPADHAARAAGSGLVERALRVRRAFLAVEAARAEL